MSQPSDSAKSYHTQHCGNICFFQYIMKYLRRILNVSRLDKIRNEIIKQRIGVTPVLDYIKKQQLKWFGYVSRSPPSGIIKRALTLRCNDRRDKSRPRRRWIEDIADTTVNTIQQIHHMALSRTLHLHCTS
jgi:hypothetical protein